MTRRLALILLLAACNLSVASKVRASEQDFAAEFQELIGQFDDAMASTAAAEALEGVADDLYDRIRQFRRDNRKALSTEERDRLGDLADEVRSLKSATRVVAQTNNTATASIENFDRVKDRLGLEPRVLQTHASGLEVVQIDVGDFSSVLLRNPTKTNLTVQYRTNESASSGGVGSALCERYAVLAGLYNSRDREIEGVEFTIQAHEIRTNSCD